MPVGNGFLLVLNASIRDRLLRAAELKATVGSRNETCFWLTCQLRDNAFPTDEIEGAVRFYHGLCPQDGHPFPLGEALATMRSALSRSPREPWATSLHGGSQQQGSDDDAPFEIKELEDFRGECLTWLIDGILPANSVVCLYGPPNVGKSMVALGMAKAIVNGSPWFGRETVRGNALWLSREGRAGFYPRETALEKHLNLSPSRRLNYVDAPFDLSDERMVRRWGDWLRHNYPARWEGRSPDLLVFDTLASAMSGNENDVEAMRPVVRSATYLREAFGCTVLLIHHTPRSNDDEMRGSSALEGALDTAVSVKGLGAEGDKTIKASCKKMRLASFFNPIFCRIADCPGYGPLVIGADAPGRENEHDSRLLLLLHVLKEKGDQRNGDLLRLWQEAAAIEGHPEQSVKESAFNRLLRNGRSTGLLEKGSGRTDPWRMTPIGEALLLSAGETAP